MMVGTKILVLDRGHVLVGRLEPAKDLAFWWRLEHARTIRQWGTSEGLHQLVNGPTAQTVLDAPANITVPHRAILFIIDVDEASWQSHLS